jgi:hypothetical protein
MFQVFQIFQRYVASVPCGCCKSRSGSCICCKCSFKMFYLFLSIFYLDVAYVSHMLQDYVPIISVTLVLCCNKCFHVASCKCFIKMLHMFHTHVSSVCSKCFICFRRMLHLSVSCFRRANPHFGIFYFRFWLVGQNAPSRVSRERLKTFGWSFFPF